MRRLALAWIVSLTLFAPALGQTPAAPPTQRIRGDIVAVDGLNVQVKARTGETLAVRLAGNYTVSAVVKIDIGSFQGRLSASRPCLSPTVRKRRSKSFSFRKRAAAAGRVITPGICSLGA